MASAIERALLGAAADAPEKLATFDERRRALEVAYQQLMSDSNCAPAKKAETIVKIMAELREQESNHRTQLSFEEAFRKALGEKGSKK